MGCAPMASVEVVHCAAPAERVTELQPGIAAPLSLNVTVPEGVPMVPESVSVRVIAWPNMDGLILDTRWNWATAGLTVWEPGPDVPARYVASPEYVTVMGCAPTASIEVAHCATPADSATEPPPVIGVPWSLNATVPEGIPMVPVSVSVRMIACPNIEGLILDTRRNVATVRLT